jgi:predicted dehydrogenase
VAGADFGELYYLDTARLNMGLYQHDVNVLWDLAPHDISILNYVLDSTPTSVECWAARHAHRRWEDIAQLRVQYAKPRVEATVHVSWLHPRKTRLVTAVGSERMVVFDDLATEERIRVHHKSVRQPELETDDMSQPPMSYTYGDMVAPYLIVNEPLAVEDEHFVHCVSTGAAPLTGGANGLAVVEVLEAAELARREARRVYIDEVRERGAQRPEFAPVPVPVPVPAIPLERTTGTIDRVLS